MFPELGIFCQGATLLDTMATMNVSIPDSLKEFVDEQVEERGFGSVSEYVRELIRRDQARSQLREALLDGARSAPAAQADAAYFRELRARARRQR